MLLALSTRASPPRYASSSDAAPVSLQAESRLGQTSVSRTASICGHPEGSRRPLAHAPDAELDALVRALKVEETQRPSETRGRGARGGARARAGRAHVARAPAEASMDSATLMLAVVASRRRNHLARREDDALFDRSVRASMTDVTRTASVEGPFDLLLDREPRETATSRRRRRRARDVRRRGDSSVSENLRDLDGSLLAVREVSVDELANGPEPVTRIAEARGNSPRARELSGFRETFLDGWRRADRHAPTRLNRAWQPACGDGRRARGWVQKDFAGGRGSSETFPFQTTITTSTTDKYHPQPILHPRGSRSMSRSVAATPRRGWRASAPSLKTFAARSES